MVSPESESVPVEAAGPASSPSTLHTLHVADRDFFARFGRMFRHVALGLNTEGVRVALLTDDPVAAADLDATPVVCAGVEPLSGWRAWRLPTRVERRLNWPPDVVHLWTTRGLGAWSDWARARGIPVVVHAFSARDVQQLAARRPRAGMHLLAGSAGLVQLARDGWPWLVEHLRVAPPAFLMPPAPSVATRAPTERTAGILWTGRVDAQAGLEVLIDALAQLRRSTHDVQAALIGVGPGVRATWKKIHAAGVQDRVTLIHEVRAWDQAMHGVEVCVVPTRQQELSLAPLLAMALGKVVICARGQIAEWFIEDQTTWQFTPGSAVELACQLSRACEGERPPRELGRSAAAYVREHFTLGRLVAQLLAVYRTAHSAPPRRTTEEVSPS